MAYMKQLASVLVLLAAIPCVRAQEVPWGEMKVSVTLTPSGEPTPAKICVLSSKDGARPVFLSQSTGTQVVRPEVAYTLDGEASLRLLAGEYRVFAGRGMEYSVSEAKAAVPAGGEAAVALVIKRELDTRGFIGADMHLHTVFSDGDTSLVERVIALAGEGVEFAVATDHEHVTDYSPVVDGLEAGKLLKSVPGDEVSTWETIGHFCAFPLPAGIEAIPNTATTGKEMFAVMRAASDKAIVQVNHPRWKGGAYFTHVGMGLFTGRAGPKFDPDFEAVEIMNEDQLWGWEMDPRVRADWFNLLNRGLKFAAVANSDSHGVWWGPNGLPRTYIASVTENPDELDPDQLMKAVRDRNCAAASAVFLTLEINGRPMGGLVPAKGGRARAVVRAQAPSWIRIESVALVVNGEITKTLSVPAPAPGSPTYFEKAVTLELRSDSWIVALAEGPAVEHPLYARPVLPRAATNPVWADADGDGMFEPLLERVRRAARRLSPEALEKEARGKPASWLRMLVGELYDRGDDNARRFLSRSAGSPDQDLKQAFMEVTISEQKAGKPVLAVPAVDVPAEEWGRAQIAVESAHPAGESLKAVLEWRNAADAGVEPAGKTFDIEAGAGVREEFAARWPAASREAPIFEGTALVTGEKAMPRAEKLKAAVYPSLRLAALAEAPVLDGRLREWPAAARIGPDLGAAVGELYMGLAGDKLYFAVRADDNSVGVPDRRIFWNGDSLELFFDSGENRGGDVYRTTSHHIWICPVPDSGTAPAFVGRWHHDGDALAKNVHGERLIETVCRTEKGGYTLEGTIPLALLGAQRGRRIYFNYGLTDKAVGTQFLSAGWDEKTNNRPGTWAAVLLP